MRKALFWVGGLLCVIGIALIGANVVMRYMGLGASYNFGDPAKFEFILVPFWQIGLVAAAVGAACLWAARRLS
jgi:TRAP-type C4-dicarboxylate transport system permease small subunit